MMFFYIFPCKPLLIQNRRNSISGWRAYNYVLCVLHRSIVHHNTISTFQLALIHPSDTLVLIPTHFSALTKSFRTSLAAMQQLSSWDCIFYRTWSRTWSSTPRRPQLGRDLECARARLMVIYWLLPIGVIAVINIKLFPLVDPFSLFRSATPRRSNTGEQHKYWSRNEFAFDDDDDDDDDYMEGCTEQPERNCC